MIKRNSNIVFYSFFFVSIFLLAVFLNYINFDTKIEHYIYLGFIVVAFLAVFLLKLFVREIIALKEQQEEQSKKELSLDKYNAEEKAKEKEEQKEAENFEQLISSFKKGIEVSDNLEKFTQNILKNFAKIFDIVQGMFFIWDQKNQYYKTANTFAFFSTQTDKQFKMGEGITGQVAKNKKILLIDNVPENYINVVSGLGEGSPKYLLFIPVISSDKVLAVIELASFVQFPTPEEKVFSPIADIIADFLNNYISIENK